MARVAAQRAQLLAGHFEDDSASMASGTTVNTRRTIPYDDPERRDMGGPRTLRKYSNIVGNIGGGLATDFYCLSWSVAPSSWTRGCAGRLE